jgi:hypothetical protein
MSEVDKIDFSQVMETSKDTLRKSIDNTKSLVKWIGDSTPQSIDNLTTKEGPYNHDQIITILSSSEWVSDEMEENIEE